MCLGIRNCKLECAKITGLIFIFYYLCITILLAGSLMCKFGQPWICKHIVYICVIYLKFDPVICTL